jgi:peptidylprolyl isomerase
MKRTARILAALALFLSSAGAAKAPLQPSPNDWRNVDPQNLVLVDTKYGETAIELAPEFAPINAARFKALIRAHFYDGKSFYRVIDGFVAQGGIGEGTASTKSRRGRDAKTAAQWPLLKAEFDRPIGNDVTFTPLGSPDLFASEVGHVDGFPVGRDPREGRMWIVHCPGTVAFARDNGPDTASTEFYIVIGEPPRRLDRNLTAFGRVIAGMQYIQKLERGDPDVNAGVIQDPAKQDRILRMRIAADLPPANQPHFQVIRTESATFAVKKEERRNITSAFFFRKPPEILDLCIMPVAVKRTGG